MKRPFFEGSWNDLLSHASEFVGERLRVTIVHMKKRSTPNGGRVQYGMFPKLKNLSEKDFKSAEWQGLAED